MSAFLRSSQRTTKTKFLKVLMGICCSSSVRNNDVIMDPMTALVLAFQILALFSIAGALLIYLICKARDDTATANRAEKLPGTVLVTSADTALGLQLCTHLAVCGCRVFAGMRDVSRESSLPAKLLCGWIKMRECTDEAVSGSIIPLQFDVTREDVLREATVAMGAHMSAGERGIVAVFNTSGSIFRGRVETQDVQQWDHMFKTNILGSLRVARTFVSFLRPTRGRLIYLGAGGSKGENGSEGLVAFNASRVAVEKCAEGLRKELQPYGIFVIALDTHGISAETLYKPPVAQQTSSDDGAPTQYTADVLSSSALQQIEHALWDVTPLERYNLTVPSGKLNFMLPSSLLRPTKFRIHNAAALISKVGRRVERV